MFFAIQPPPPPPFLRRGAKRFRLLLENLWFSACNILDASARIASFIKQKICFNNNQAPATSVYFPAIRAEKSPCNICFLSKQKIKK